MEFMVLLLFSKPINSALRTHLTALKASDREHSAELHVEEAATNKKLSKMSNGVCSFQTTALHLAFVHNSQQSAGTVDCISCTEQIFTPSFEMALEFRLFASITHLFSCFMSA